MKSEDPTDPEDPTPPEDPADDDKIDDGDLPDTGMAVSLIGLGLAFASTLSGLGLLVVNKKRKEDDNFINSFIERADGILIHQLFFCFYLAI